MAKNYLIEILIDSLRCKKSKMFQTALIGIILTIEYTIIEQLKALKIDIYEKNRDNAKYYHTLSQLNDEAYHNGLISEKMYDRLKAINMIRKFGAHSKSGETIEGDVETAYNAFKQLLKEINDYKGAQSKIVKEVISKINIIEREVKNQKNLSFMGLVHGTNEIGRTFTMDSMLKFALLVCDKDIFIVLAMITKYRPKNVEYLKKLLRPFNLKEKHLDEILRKLVAAGAVFIGHPHDVRMKDFDLAPVELRNDLFSELEKYFKAHWPIIFRNYRNIEEDYDKPRDI
jgi:hypothetical protein